jgi:hypothetical protein
VEALQRRVECTGDVEVARAAEDLIEVALELEHVAEIFGARETEATVYLGWHVIVAHLLTKCSGECGGHLRTSQVRAVLNCDVWEVGAG